MDRQRKAVPTEYKGVRFRSKSEACFAMYLDHQKDEWEYEPEQLKLECGYVPDFLIIRYLPSSCRFYAMLVEYKPRRPTETYTESTMEKLKILSHHVGIDCYFSIVYGSFWERMGVGRTFERGSSYGHHEFWRWNHDAGDEWGLRQYIAQHRFDLVSELSSWKGHL